MNKLKFIFVCFIFLSLAGCTGMNSNFGCNAKAGDSCTPVSQVNANAEAGDYDNTESRDSASSSNSNTQTFGYAAKTTGYSVATPMPGEPIRYGESVQRVWIAPYQDDANNYHEPSYVYMVLQAPHWIGLPQNEINVNADSDGD